MSRFTDEVEQTRDTSVWSLTTWADTRSPYDPSGDGGDFLEAIRDAVADAAEEVFEEGMSGDDFEDIMSERGHEDVDSMQHLIYTHITRRVFIDLDLWDEEDELGGNTMDEQVSNIVYQVGTRLFGALAHNIAEAIREDEAEADEEEDE